mmetsp:Transcript_7337/g.12156  ORF Transcript_7337/g.12156 Transcript_7337/m.12156 type:complete len:208 (-) Transcript_7337:363-986(-)
MYLVIRIEHHSFRSVMNLNKKLAQHIETVMWFPSIIFVNVIQFLSSEVSSFDEHFSVLICVAEAMPSEECLGCIGQHNDEARETIGKLFSFVYHPIVGHASGVQRRRNDLAPRASAHGPSIVTSVESKDQCKNEQDADQSELAACTLQPCQPRVGSATRIGRGVLVQLFGERGTGAGPHHYNYQGRKEEDLLSTEGYDETPEQPAPE